MTPNSANSDAVLTPTQLNRLAKDLLEDAIGVVSVEAEISGLTRASSGHYYFTLKDERAQIRSALFKSSAARLKFAPQNGLKVVARGRISLYEATGSYQLIADSLALAGTGDLHQAFEELKAKLTAEGLFDTDRKRAIPAMPRRIAVITSPTGAAIRDVLSVLERRFHLIDVDVVPVLMQGDQAAPQIVRALQAVDAAGRHDVVLLTRGGGSLEDLWAFNEEPVVRAVAAMNTPTVVAVGHETDFSLAEFAADLRGPTPSAAAELLVPERADLGRQLNGLQARMEHLLQRRWQTMAQRLDRAQLRLSAQHPQAQLAKTQDRFRVLMQRLQSGMDHGLSLRSSQLNGLGRALNSVNPLQTLERGYAVVRDSNDHVVQSAQTVARGDALRISLRSGELLATVTDTLPETQE